MSESIWSSVGNFLKGSLPVIGTALGGPAGAVVGSVLSMALGTNDNPDAVLDTLRQDPDAIIKYKLAELQTNRDVLVAFEQAEQEKLRIVNETMRSEHNSHDAFVRRWRPFYGYAVALSWFIQMTSFSFMFTYVAINNSEELANLVQQFAVLSGALISLWGIALAVLGVSVHQRSRDKKGVSEQAKGFLSGLIKR